MHQMDSTFVKNVGKLCGHKDSINGIDYGGSAETLVSVSNEAARMWDLNRFKASRCFLPCGNQVQCSFFSETVSLI